MQIEILQVKVDTKANKNGGAYQLAEIAYKNLNDGKVGGKKLMSFKDPSVFSKLAEAKMGEVFEVKSEKIGEYWEWTHVGRLEAAHLQQKQEASTQHTQVNGTGIGSGFSKTPIKATYETPEERAKKQIYIIKQSSVSSAIALLSVGAKLPPALSDVLKTAQEICNFVTTNKLEDMLDDIPFDLSDIEVQ